MRGGCLSRRGGTGRLLCLLLLLLPLLLCTLCVLTISHQPCIQPLAIEKSWRVFALEHHFQDYNVQLEVARHSARESSAQNQGLIDSPVLSTIPRTHANLRQDGLFETLHKFPFLKILELRTPLEQIVRMIDDGFYHYSSTGCASLLKTAPGPVQYYEQWYNAQCVDNTSGVLVSYPLTSRLHSLDIGLPLDYTHKDRSSSMLWNYLIILGGAYITSRGAVVSRNLTLYPLQCQSDYNVRFYNRYFLKTYEEVFALSGHFDFEYYHSLVEDLPKITPYIPFLLRHPQIKIHVYRDLGHHLQLLGLGADRLVYGFIRANTVYMPSAYPCGTSGILNTKLLSYYFRQALPPVELHAKRTIVLIHRSDKYRRFTQHDEMLQMLQMKGRRKGLSVVVFGDNPSPSLAETQRIFHQALMVVGPHGAGLSNIMFCQPGTAVIEGLHYRDPPDKAANLCYTSLSLALGLRYYGVYFEDRDLMEHTVHDYEEVVQIFLDNMDMLVKPQNQKVEYNL